MTAKNCRRKFLRFFPDGFYDETYLDWERNYKQAAHDGWERDLNQKQYRALLKAGDFAAIAQSAVRLESRTNLLFSFEKMAIRDAIKPAAGAKAFAEGLFEFVYGRGDFEKWCAVVGSLPRKQTRVLTWPVVTVFPFIAKPDTEIFLKPNVTRRAAEEYGFDFQYASKPNRETYSSLCAFAERIRKDLRDLKPRDMIDLQSFIWVQGSDEYD